MTNQLQMQANDKTRKMRLLEGAVLYGPFAIALVFFACCVVIELLQIDISMERRDLFYSVFGSVSYYSSILLNVVYGRKYGLGWVRSLIFSLASFFLLFSYTSQAWTWLDEQMFGMAALASFRSAMFLPLLCLILSRFCKVDTLNLCDYLTPYFFFHHGVVTVPCWISGCCAGSTCSWGLRNPLSGLTVFPTQPCIILLSVGVALWGLLYSKKHDYKANGKVFAYSLCVYGIGRYVIELFSDDARVWWVLSWLAICSLAMIVEGFVVRFIASKRYQTLS